MSDQPTPSESAAEVRQRLNLEDALSQANEALFDIKPGQPRRLDFTWRGVSFALAIKGDSEHRSHLFLNADLGRLPYTAENAEARSALIDVLSGREELPGAALRLDARDRLILSSETTIDSGLCERRIIDILAVILLHMKAPLHTLSHLVVGVDRRASCDTVAAA